MNFSKPSTFVGGGEMNRDTSSVVSSAKSEGASDARSSRRTTCSEHSVGRPSRQSVVTTGVVWFVVGIITVSISMRKGIFSIRYLPRSVVLTVEGRTAEPAADPTGVWGADPKAAVDRVPEQVLGPTAEPEADQTAAARRAPAPAT